MDHITRFPPRAATPRRSQRGHSIPSLGSRQQPWPKERNMRLPPVPYSIKDLRWEWRACEVKSAAAMVDTATADMPAIRYAPSLRLLPSR